MDALTRALSKCNGSILKKAFNEQVDLELTLTNHEVVNFLNIFN
jgi:hypothetical protein